MGKFKTIEDAEKALAKVKEELKPLTKEKQAIIFKQRCKESEITDKAILKTLKALNEKITPLKAKRDEIGGEISELKPKGPRVGVPSGKYDYPEGMSSADKKKFRAQKRREENAASKGEAKASKSEKKPEKPVTKEAPKADKKVVKADKKEEKAPLKKPLPKKKED